jgi:hypothetical protein
MAKFVIQPHFRLQEWVAEEKGYFKEEGLDYVFREQVRSSDGKVHVGDRRGAFQVIEEGVSSNISCACHWTVDVAASQGHGKLYSDVYSVSPAGIFVPPDSPIRTPEQLAGVPISVGFQSGSHYSTIQGLEQFMPFSDIKLSFAEGMLFHRMELLIENKIPAASLFSGPYYFAEQLGYRKIMDTTFMIATILTGSPNLEDVRKFFRALKRAQRDIDLRPDLYTHYFENEFPERFHSLMDTRRWGPGERIVFEPYTKELFEETFKWIAEREIFERDVMGTCDFEASAVTCSTEPGS